MAARRLDAAVFPSSRLQFIIVCSGIALFLLLSWSAKLSLWQFILVVAVSGLTFGYWWLSRPIVTQITQPPLHLNAHQGWQLMMATSRGDQLWHGELRQLRTYSWVVVADFAITEPYQRSLTLSIFRDQVAPEDWRRLIILSQLIN